MATQVLTHVAEHRERELLAELVRCVDPLLACEAAKRDHDWRHESRETIPGWTTPRLAERLDAFAALLELNGSGFYTTRAYRRAAELIRTTPADVAAVVRAGRVRELRGIGPGIEARLRELVETGELAELRELESEVMPELVAVGRLLGLSPKRMRELGSALDVRTLEELRAVEPDRLESVPGIGPKTAARIREGLAGLGGEVRPRHGLTLNRARALVERDRRGARRRACR